MIGGFCMPRTYTHVHALENEIMLMKESGKTNREIAEHFGFKNKYVVKQLVARKNRRERYIQAGIQLRSRGRPPKSSVNVEQAKDNEIKRLKMENELLRDFLRLVGRM